MNRALLDQGFSTATSVVFSMSDGEITVVAHKISLDELCKRLNTSIETGLTNEQVLVAQKEHGLNNLGQVDLAKKFFVKRNGARAEIPVAELTVGDIVEVKGGDKIPADIRIVKSDGLEVDQSSLTGDSNWKIKSPEAFNENPLASDNVAFFNMPAMDGSAVGIVYAIGSKTIYGQVAHLATPLEPEIAAQIAAD